MADTAINIGFNVANGDLKDGLDKAVQDFETTRAAIQQDLDAISQGAKATGDVLVTFADAETRQDATAATRRKAAAEGYAEETSNIEILKTLNQISASEAIADQMQIENAKFQRLSGELQQEAAAANATLEIRKQLQNQLDAVESQHFAKLRQLNQEAVADAMRSWQEMLTPISNAFSSSLSGMITGQENFRQALARVGDAIVSDFVNMAVKRATNWAAGELTMTSASAAGDAARTASHDAAIVEGQAASAAAGSVSVFGDANKAAAGAFSAVAEIPIVGPILAPAAAVAAFTAVMAYDVFSAQGGFDIPAGLNPVTQLHEREMVLPASIAEPLRNNLSRGRGGSGGDIHIHAVDAASFQRLLANNKSALAKTLRAAHRGFDPAFA